MTPINNQTFQNFTHTQSKAVSTQSHDRFSTGRGPHQSRAFESMLGKADSMQTNSISKELSDALAYGRRSLKNQVQFNNVDSNIRHLQSSGIPLPFRINLQSGVGAKALHDLQQIGPLTHQQVRALVSDIRLDIQHYIGDPSFDTKLEQLKLAALLLEGFESMAHKDGKPGLSAVDIRRTAANDGNPNNLSGQDINQQSLTRAEAQAQVGNALRGGRNIDLRSGVGAKALHDLQNIGPLTHQQTLTLRSDLLRNIQQLIRFNPEGVTSVKLDQIALVSLMLNGFERNAAEDGRPGFSAEDLRRVAARTGDSNILSRRDT